MQINKREFDKILRTSSVMVSLFIAATACLPSGDMPATPTPLPPPVSYEKATYTVDRGPVVSEVTVSGRLWPSQYDELYFLADGYVTRVTVSEGDIVSKGQLLAELQVDDLLSQLEQAQIDLDAAKADLAEQENSRQYAVDRAQRQVNIEELKVELARLAVEESVGNPSELKTLQIELAIAEENLALAQIALAETSREVGQDQRPAIQRMELEIDRLVVRARQESRFIGKVDEDSEVRMRLSSNATTSYAATFMSDLFPPSDDATGSRTVNRDWIYFSLPSSMENDSLEVGKPVHLSIVLGRVDDALRVPPAAVHEFRGRRYLIVREGDRQRRVDVRTGLETHDYWEIIGDVTEGDQVVGP
jgi:multidrug efflux pump subunit AcrA (membrane-fusion protein)